MTSAKESLQRSDLLLRTQQFFQLVYFKALPLDGGKLFFSLGKQLIYQLTVSSCVLRLLLPHTYPNKPPTEAFPNETTTSISSVLILLWFVVCTVFSPPSCLAQVVFLPSAAPQPGAASLPAAEAVRGGGSLGTKKP